MSVARTSVRVCFGLALGFAVALLFLILESAPAGAHPGRPGEIHHESAAAPGSCEAAGLLPVGDTGLCTHGPDLPPPGVTPAEVDAPLAFTSAADSAAVCAGDGTSGQRVQVIYARGSDQPERYRTYLESIRTWAAQADRVYQNSADKTGGQRFIRFVHDSSCTIEVLDVVLSPEGDDSYTAAVSEMYDLGYTEDDRRYLVFLDSPSASFCGQATVWNNDAPDLSNPNNVRDGIAVVFNGCWADGVTAAHELGHNFGSVQHSAPNATGFYHCTDEHDVMCYVDGPGVQIEIRCPGDGNQFLLDCNNDDYFHTNPPAGSYLATHWNSANSGFLGTSLPSPALTLDKTKSKYNGWVRVTLTGFQPGYTINVRWPGGSLLAQVRADSSGNAVTRFRTPLMPLGDYEVRATDSSGNAASATLRVIPRIMLAPEYVGPTGFRFRIYFYGYAPGDRVQVQWYTESGASYDVLKTITVADTGRASTILYVPDDASTGDHLIRGKVIGVSRSTTTTFTVTGPGAADEPTETPTPEPTLTPEPTETVEPTPEPTEELPTETPSLEPTLEVPTETPTPEPTEEVPTETPTPEPSGTPVVQSEERVAAVGRRSA